MEKKNRDTLLETDWADLWESLPDAPPLVPRPKTSQVTLRVPAQLIVRLKAIAAAKSLPYHSLARSYVAEALMADRPPAVGPEDDEPHSAQLNLKLDQNLLDDLKRKAGELRRPYHALARECIEDAVEREEKALGVGRATSGRPAMSDLIVLLLHAPGSRGDVAIRGMTRLQKLLFVIEQKVSPGQHFYAHNYGPFDEAVHDATNALRLAGFLRGSTPVSAAAPSFAVMLAIAEQRSGPRDPGRPDVFVLSDSGHEVAERLRRSSRAYEALFAGIAEIRQEWDTPNLDDLVDRVYATWPQYAAKSLIQGEVAERTRRRERP
jgi:predicted DNA binding CopG/RHH family protein